MHFQAKFHQFFEENQINPKDYLIKQVFFPVLTAYFVNKYID